MMQKELRAAAKKLQSTFGRPPAWAVIFGSGLGRSLRTKLRVIRQLKFSQIPYFPKVGVEGHGGHVLVVRGSGGGAPALFLEGRVHFYEGFSPERVVFAVRALAVWGVKRLLLTNASGALSPRLGPGDLVQITDHLNFTGVNPLRGPNLDFLGPRFPSLASAYENDFARSIARASRAVGVSLKKGVYAGVAGPSYETTAEVKAFRKLGGDLIGMSTVLEVIAAVHAGLEVAAIGVVTNRPLKRDVVLDHREVLKNAQKGDVKLAKILIEMLKNP